MVVFEQDNDNELNATINDIQEDSMGEIISHFAMQRRRIRIIIVITQHKKI